MIDTTKPQDALVHEIGALILADERVSAQPWESYALVVRLDQSQIQLNGFAYQGDVFHPATPRAPVLHEKLQMLREAMRQLGRAPWGACVVRIDRARKKICMEFEYDNPQRWDMTAQTAAEVAQRARLAS